MWKGKKEREYAMSVWKGKKWRAKIKVDQKKIKEVERQENNVVQIRKRKERRRGGKPG